jgi:hypothetical protein
MRFSRIIIKAVIAISPLLIIGCGSDGGAKPSSATSTPTATVTTTMMTATQLDTRDLTQRLTTLSSIINLGAALNADALDDLFLPDRNYGTSNGLTRAQDIASIVAIFGPNGTNTNGKVKGIENVEIVSDLTSDYANRGVSKAYLLNYDFVFENGIVVHGNDVTFGKELNGGQWKFIGGPNGSHLGNNYGVIFTSGPDTVSPIIIDPPALPSVTFGGS